MFGDAVHGGAASQDLLEEFVNILYMAQRTFKAKLPIFTTVMDDEELQSITVPTLYIVGENDKIYSAQKALQRLKDVAPHIKAEIVASAGHGVALSHAQLVNRKVLEFLKEQ